jgi:PhzF family phenazine biosynthesis protein
MMEFPLFAHERLDGLAHDPRFECWLSDDVQQRIAMENSVAETAFFNPLDDGFEIRWFTPEIEMDLCGVATLATAILV